MAKKKEQFVWRRTDSKLAEGWNRQPGEPIEGYEAQRDKNARMRAIEMARASRTRDPFSDMQTAADVRENGLNMQVNAGDNRSTEPSVAAYRNIDYSTASYAQRAGQMPDAGNNATTATYPVGMSYAQRQTQGYDADNTKVTQNVKREAEKNSITEAESLAHANEVLSPYNRNPEAKKLIERAADAYELIDGFGGDTDNYDYKQAAQELRYVKMDLKNKYNLSGEELDKVIENQIWMNHYTGAIKKQGEIDNASPVVKGALPVFNTIMSPITRLEAGLAAASGGNKTNDPELGKDWHNPNYDLTDLREQTDTAIHKDIDENIKNKPLNFVANHAYDLATMMGDSYTAAAIGPAGLASYGAGSYQSNLREAENRGLPESQAQTYAVIMGVTEIATEKIPFDHLSDLLKNGAGKEEVKGLLNPTVKAILVQFGEEGGEELANDIVDDIADSLINGDQSKNNIRLQYYMSQEYADENNNGVRLTEDEAFSLVVKERALEYLQDGVMGGLSGAGSAGAAIATNSVLTNIDSGLAGRDLVKDEALVNEILNNPEHPDYISTDIDDYDTNEDYEAAQQAREDLQKASENATINNKRPKLRESAKVYQNTVKALKSRNDNSSIPEEYRNRKTSEAETLDALDYASDPYRLALAAESVSKMTPAIQERYAEKVEQLKDYNFTQEQIDNAITAQKAYKLGLEQTKVTDEDLKSIPEAYREKVKLANQEAYNKKFIEEHPNAVIDTKTGDAIIPQSVEIKDNSLVVVDQEGNEHTEYYNPLTSAVDKYADKYNMSPAQEKIALEFALASSNSKSADFNYSLNQIRNAASLGTKGWNDFLKANTFVSKLIEHNRIDSKKAQELYESIYDATKAADTQKAKSATVKNEGKVTDTVKEMLESENKAFAELVQAYAKKTGTNIVAINYNNDTRAAYIPEKGEIALNKANAHQLWISFIHEAVGEKLQRYANAEDIRDIQNDILNYLEETLGESDYNRLIDSYQFAYRQSESKVDQNKTRREAANETANDFMAGLFSSEKGLSEFVDWVTEAKTANQQVTILQKIKDMFDSFLKYIKDFFANGKFNAAETAALNMAEDRAEALRQKILKALDQAIANRDAQIGKTLINVNGEKYLLSNDGKTVTGENGSKYHIAFLSDNALENIVGDKTGAAKYKEISNYILSEIDANNIVMSDGLKVTVDNRDASHIASKSGNKKTSEIEKIKELINESKAYAEDKNVEHNKFDYFRYYMAFVKFRNEVFPIYLNVGRAKNDGGYHLYDITHKLKNTADRINGLGRLNGEYRPASGVLLNNSVAPEAEKSIDNLSKNSEKTVNTAQERKSIAVGDIEQQAIEHFGTTDSFRVAGYMLQDGTLLDFSGAHWLEGEDPAYIEKWKSQNDIRQVDHEDIYEVMEASGDNRKQFMDRGNIRLNPEAPGFNLSTKVEPTAAQYRELKEFIREIKKNPYYDASRFYVDIEDTHPNKISYANNLNEDRIINDIKKFYETGELPQQSSLNDFRFSINVSDDRVLYHRGTEIIQNPTSKEYEQMEADILKERPWLKGEPLLRHTYDEQGNEYYWDAYAGLHSQIEPAIAKHWNTRVNQQWKWYEDQDKDFWANRSWRNSITVYGDASPYADSINQTKIVEEVLSTINNNLKGTSVSMKFLDKTVDEIIKKYQADVDANELKMELSQFIAHMTADESVNYDQMMNYLLNVGDKIIKSSTIMDEEEQRIYDETKSFLKGYSFKLSKEEIAELKYHFGDWNTAFGVLNQAGINLDATKGASVDRVFSELQQGFLETSGINLEKYNKPSDQIIGLIDVMSALEPRHNAFEGANALDNALDVAVTIIDSYYAMADYTKELSIINKTEKGKQRIQKALSKETAKVRENLRSQFNKYKETKEEAFKQLVLEKNQIIQQQQNQLRAQEAQMKKWDEAAKDQVKQQKLTAEQMKRTAKIQALEAVQSYKEAQERAKQIENIRKSGIRMIKWLAEPTEKQHIPNFLQKPLGEFLAAIDFLPANAKADSKSTLSWQQRMQTLRDTLIKIREAEIEGEDSPEAYFAQSIVTKDLLAMMDDFLGKESWDEFTQSYVTTKRAAKKVSLLEAKELQTLNKIMSGLSAAINNMNKTYANEFYKEVDELARVSYEELNELKKDKVKYNRYLKSLGDFFVKEKTPVYFFDELGKGSKSVFDELQQGWNLRTNHIREASEHISEFKKANNITDKEMSKWSSHVNEFNLSEGKIELTDAQIMSLYRIVNRKQGRPHVMLGGIRPADTVIGNKTTHYNKAVHINAGDYQKIISVLSEEQIKMADEMQKYMATECAKWGNRVAEKMFGYKKFEESDYFPLKTDAHSRAVTNTSDNNVGYNSIKNSSFTKNIVPNANNAVMLEDIFDVFTGHVEQMANYDGFVMPIADAMRWFNYSEKVVNATEEGLRVDVVSNMQEAIEGVLGTAGTDYFRTFIKNINGIYEGKGGDIELANKLASGYKAQAVMANLRVALQQPMAIARAIDRIEDKYILQAVALPTATLGIAANKWAKKAQKNSALAFWKAQGYYETMIGQSMKSIITGEQSFKDWINEKGGWLAGKMDDITWGVIYRASELKVSKEHPELAYDSEEYTKEVVKQFEEVINYTQVVDTIFHKSEYMRSKSAGTKMLTAFMAEPTLTLNMANHRRREAIIEFSNGNKAAALKTITKLMRVLIANDLLLAFAQSLMDALRDDEPDKELYEKFLKYMFGLSEDKSIKDILTSNVVDNVNPLNWLPLTKEIMSYIQGYDASNMYVDAIYTVGDSVSMLADMITTGEVSKTGYGALYTIAKGVSQTFGVPISNTMREFKTLYNNINNLWGGSDLYTSKRMQKQAATAPSKKELKVAIKEGNLTDINNAITSVYNQSIEAGKDESGAWTAVRDELKEHFLSEAAEAQSKGEITKLINRYTTFYCKTKKKKGDSYVNYSEKEARGKVEKWYSDNF